MLSASPIIAQKQRQIDALRSRIPGTIEVHAGFHYRIQIYLSGSSISLEIQLPDNFPKDKPIFWLSPPQQHPCVRSSDGRFVPPQLNEFKMHSDLGKLVERVIQDLRERPPTAVSAVVGYNGTIPPFNQIASYPNMPLYPSLNSEVVNTPKWNSDSKQVFNPYQPQPTQVIESPKKNEDNGRLAKISKQLEKLSREELEILLHDDEAFRKYMKYNNSNSSPSSLKYEKSRQRKMLRDLASDNLKFEEEFEHMTEKLLNLADIEARKVIEVNQRNRDYQEMSSRYQPMEIYKELEKGTRKLDNETEDIAYKFARHGDAAESGEFIELFLSERKKVLYA